MRKLAHCIYKKLVLILYPLLIFIFFSIYFFSPKHQNYLYAHHYNLVFFLIRNKTKNFFSPLSRSVTSISSTRDHTEQDDHPTSRTGRENNFWPREREKERRGVSERQSESERRERARGKEIKVGRETPTARGGRGRRGTVRPKLKRREPR